MIFGSITKIAVLLLLAQPAIAGEIENTNQGNLQSTEKPVQSDQPAQADEHQEPVQTDEQQSTQGNEDQSIQGNVHQQQSQGNEHQQPVEQQNTNHQQRNHGQRHYHSYHYRGHHYHNHDNNRHSYYPQPPLYKVPNLPILSESYHTNIKARGTSIDSLATNPLYPSAFGLSLKGVPTIADYSSLNQHVAATQQAIPALERARLHSLQYIEGLTRSKVGIKTEALDQGPLGPAPHSSLEYAGWLEYLALLFGDAGNATALRQILSRLTRLAQTDLSEGDAQKAQAATAFLAEHFKSLLKASYSSFLFDNRFVSREAAWSQDSNIAGVFALLVDKMDIFGAQQHFSQAFGDNAQYALSLGNRQPEWLQLKLVLETIAWDVQHQNDLLSLWSTDWKLTLLQKLSILAYATNPSLNAPLDPNMPHREQVRARVNLITNGELPRDNDIIHSESPLDQAHYKYARLQLSGALCKEKSFVQNSESSNGPVAVATNAFKQRVDDYCELTNLTPTFTQFCQSDSKQESTPIAALLSASKPLFKSKLIAYVAHLERLFWAFVWTGACTEARDVSETLASQLQVLKPRKTFVRQGKRVPSDVADSVHQRLQYMQLVIQRCTPNVAVSNSADAARILSLLQFQHIDDAMFSWEHVFSQVAARLEGYPQGPALIASGESELLFAQARDVRLAILLYKYPKAIYAPCLGRGLLTGDANTDLTLMNLAHSIDTSSRLRGKHLQWSTSVPEMNRRSLYMRAHFIAGDHRGAAQVAREIYGSNGGDEFAKAMIACTQLCGTSTRNPCESSEIFSQLLSTDARQDNPTQTNHQHNHRENHQESPQTNPQENPQTNPAKTKPALVSAYTTGKELSSRLCRLNRNTAADALSLRYGKVLTTQSLFSALERILHASKSKSKRKSRLTSKLLPGGAESVLPWFGILPPAPIEDILSFSPVNSGDYKTLVGIRGMPIIKLSDENGNSNSNDNGTNNSNMNGNGENASSSASNSNYNGSNAPAPNSKVYVLGKEYDANYLKEGERGNLQPKIEVNKGIYQFSIENENHEPTSENQSKQTSAKPEGNPVAEHETKPVGEQEDKPVTENEAKPDDETHPADNHEESS